MEGVLNLVDFYIVRIAMILLLAAASLNLIFHYSKEEPYSSKIRKKLIAFKLTNANFITIKQYKEEQYF